MSNKFKEIDGVKYIIADPTIINNDSNVCFLIEGKHWRLNRGAIDYDYTKKRYVLKSSIHVENGFVGINSEDAPILGSWSWPEDHLLSDSVVANYQGQSFLCISEDIFAKTNWEERLFDGQYYLKSDLPVKEFSKIKSVPREVKNELPYNASEEIKKATQIYEKKFKVAEFNKGVALYPQILGKYTYGYEFETSKGIVPSRLCNRLGLIPLRDGSIDGIEYATIPLEGKAGIQTIIDTCEELNKRTITDHDCSLHIHIGGMPRTEAYFITLTKILCSVQEEMYEMFPFYARGGFGLKKKDYTAPLPAVELMSRIDNNINLDSSSDIIKNFEPVFEFLSMGHKYADYGRTLKKVTSHPSDPGGTSKWYVKSRYRWVNMIPLLFGNKKTIEFRIHTPSFDPNKILFFTIICASIVDAAVRMGKPILTGNLRSYSLSDFVYSYLSQFGDKYATLHDIINKYMYDRKQYTRRCIQDRDFYGDESKFKIRHTLYPVESNKYAHLIEGDVKQYLNPDSFDYREVRTDGGGWFTDSPPVPSPYSTTRTRAGRTTTRPPSPAEIIERLGGAPHFLSGLTVPDDVQHWERRPVRATPSEGFITRLEDANAVSEETEEEVDL